MKFSDFSREHLSNETLNNGTRAYKGGDKCSAGNGRVPVNNGLLHVALNGLDHTSLYENLYRFRVGQKLIVTWPTRHLSKI